MPTSASRKGEFHSLRTKWITVWYTGTRRKTGWRRLAMSLALLWSRIPQSLKVEPVSSPHTFSCSASTYIRTVYLFWLVNSTKLTSLYLVWNHACIVLMYESISLVQVLWQENTLRRIPRKGLEDGYSHQSSWQRLLAFATILWLFVCSCWILSTHWRSLGSCHAAPTTYQPDQGGRRKLREDFNPGALSFYILTSYQSSTVLQWFVLGSLQSVGAIGK